MEGAELSGLLDDLGLAVMPTRRLVCFDEAFSDGRHAFLCGKPLDPCPINGPLQAAWWRRGWRQAHAEAVVEGALDRMDDRERREVDPELDWEGASC